MDVESDSDYDIDILNDNGMDTEEKYVYVLNKHIKLIKKYRELCINYSENTIIQSMHDMKERYEELQRETVSLFRYNQLEKDYKHQNKVINAVLVILEKTSNRLRDIELLDKDKEIYRCEIELLIITDLLQEIIKN